jgi:tetratricopeptide (TPR) repeat protein/DNA-binding PadR family transcriptional regulator
LAGELTVSERILFHLSNYVKFEDKYEVPFDVTQDGISQACSISRAHAAIELKKLKSGGVIEEKLSHVRRGKARRKVYFLTFEGKARATKVAQYVRESDVNPMVDASKVAPELSSSRIRSLKKSSAFPSASEFYGREKEMQSAKEAIASSSVKTLSIRGIAGIGKTTLAARLCQELSDQRIFWHSSKSWEAQRTIEEALGRFFADNGCRRLASYMSSGKTEFGEMSFLLNEELSENGYVFVFDDADASAWLQEFIKMFRHSSGSAKIIATSESEPWFYERSDVVAKKEVAEIELGGLDRKAALQILSRRGIEGAVASELVKSTHGHPLSLEMVTARSRTEARNQISRFLEDKFYSVLSDNEKALLQYASVFRRPFPTDAIPRELRQARRGSMLREVAPDMFEIHGTLRDFVYGSMTKDEKARWHSAAADYYLRSGEAQERLMHLVKAGRTLEAEIFLARAGEQLIGEGNVQQLWEVLASFAPSKPKYMRSVNLLRARSAVLLGKYDDARPLLEEISQADDPRLSSAALVEMGEINSRVGDLRASSGQFSQALEKAKDLPCERAKALRGLGMVERKSGNYSKAEELLLKSAQEALAAMDQKGMSLAHLELGNVFIDRGKYQESIDHFSKCAAGFGPVDLANVYINMGRANARLDRFAEARQHLQNAVRLADETGQPRVKAQALDSLADVMFRIGETEQAKENCFKALEIVTELGDKLATSSVYSTLALAESSAGDFVASEEHYGESVRALEGMTVPKVLGARKMDFGIMCARMGDHKRARELLRESVDIFEGAGAADLAAGAKGELEKMR